MTVAGNHGKDRAEQTFLSCHLNPSLQSFPPSVSLSLSPGPPVPIQCQGPADCCPLSSIKAISVEVTRACRLAQENLHTDPHLNFCLLASMILGPRWQDSAQLNMSESGVTMPPLCWHYTPSLWPWSLWTLSCTVSMTTTQARLRVACVGGFACREWELHNTARRERVWQPLEMRINLYEFCNGTITEHVMGKMAMWLFLFILSSISRINTLHNCCGSYCSPSHEIVSFLWHVPVLWQRHQASSCSPWASCLRGKILQSHVERPPLLRGITLHRWASPLLSPVLLTYTTEPGYSFNLEKSG